MTTVNVKLDDGAYLPEKAHDTDAGYDLRTPYEFLLEGGQSKVIDTGVHVEIPDGYVGFLKSKSGLNVNHDITGEGVIDCGYTGSIKVKLYNNSNKPYQFPYQFQKGDKIIQLVILPILKAEMKVVDDLSDTERGDNGFGSSGR
jgi:dUTP pyrophosphatase